MLSAMADRRSTAGLKAPAATVVQEPPRIIQLNPRGGFTSDLRSGWEQQAMSELGELLSLAPGWDGYNGRPLRPDIAMFAMVVLGRAMLPFTPFPSLVPTGAGGVQIEWHTNGFDIEFHIVEPLSSELWVEDHHGRTTSQVDVHEDLATLQSAVRVMTQRLIAKKNSF